MRAPQGEGAQEQLAQLGVGLHDVPEVRQVDLEQLARLHRACADQALPPRDHVHLAGELDPVGEIPIRKLTLQVVEQLSGLVQVIVAGRLAASGDFRAIRRLMTSRPHVFTVRSSDDRLLASTLIGGTLTGRSAVTAVELTRAGLQVRTSDYGAFCRDIAVLARDHGIRLREVLPADESLESVFAYLVAD